MPIRGTFDGKVIVLNDTPPANWIPNMPVIVVVDQPPPSGPCQALVDIASRATDLGLPPDFSEQHDHYVHGTPKRD